jgi:hypothetical protein
VNLKKKPFPACLALCEAPPPADHDHISSTIMINVVSVSRLISSAIWLFFLSAVLSDRSVQGLELQGPRGPENCVINAQVGSGSCAHRKVPAIMHTIRHGRRDLLLAPSLINATPTDVEGALQIYIPKWVHTLITRSDYAPCLLAISIMGEFLSISRRLCECHP